MAQINEKNSDNAPRQNPPKTRQLLTSPNETETPLLLTISRTNQSQTQR